MLSFLIACFILYAGYKLYMRVGELDLTPAEQEQTRSILLVLVVITVTLLAV